MNFGEILVDGDNVLGDTVNVACQLERFADPGGICLSEAVYRQVHDKIDAIFVAMGERQVMVEAAIRCPVMT